MQEVNNLFDIVLLAYILLANFSENQEICVYKTICGK